MIVYKNENFFGKENLILVEYTKKNFLDSFLNKLNIEKNINDSIIINKSIDIEYMNFCNHIYTIEYITKQEYLNIISKLKNININTLSICENFSNFFLIFNLMKMIILNVLINYNLLI